ncbi:MAG: TonB-dependent receptor [Flavobacteriaceae bacterium]|nr:TonB-dependent receptor [Flavobacteriaceae bacterium]
MKMQSYILMFFFLVIGGATTWSQQTVSGKVTDKKGNLLLGVNVYLEGTYDGGTTNENGNFSFETQEGGVQVLHISFLGFETQRIEKEVLEMRQMTIRLRESVNSLKGVTVTAGTFEAGDNAKVSVLKPLDVVTTASAMGDFVGALQTLPGTSTVSEDGRLFVRGGTADETQIFIDGIRVFTPYSPTTNNIPARGRFSPFLFKGITFSTGGYSAEYGEALSSVLLLNSVDEPDQEITNIGLMSVGGALGKTEIWGKHSLSVNASYINLAPYLEIFKDRNDWQKPVESFGGEAVYRYKTENQILKWYSAYSGTGFELVQEDINLPEGVSFGLRNGNVYSNLSYKAFLEDGWSLRTGLSYSRDIQAVDLLSSDIDRVEQGVHAKIALKKQFSDRWKFRFGAEHFYTDFVEDYVGDGAEKVVSDALQHHSAVYGETDLIFSNKFAAKLGLRTTYTKSSGDFGIEPRFSMAYKLGEYGQASLAYGQFNQNPRNEYLRFGHDLKAERADHFILNYQYVNNGRIFRAEAYYKDYKSLLRYDQPELGLFSSVSNDGVGYASGLDLFWRDNKSFKYLDYWLSYSYLDTERLYRDFPTRARPSFANKHNFSVVGKYWIDDWKSQVGISYGFASGRTFTNKNKLGFLNDQTKSYHNISLNWSYLISQQKILYVAVSNVSGYKNVNGYQYADTPNMDGVFDRRALRPAADQFFFVGFFWTISDDKKSNQLDNL